MPSAAHGSIHAFETCWHLLLGPATLVELPVYLIHHVAYVLGTRPMRHPGVDGLPRSLKPDVEPFVEIAYYWSKRTLSSCILMLLVDHRFTFETIRFVSVLVNFLSTMSPFCVWETLTIELQFFPWLYRNCVVCLRIRLMLDVKTLGHLRFGLSGFSPGSMQPPPIDAQQAFSEASSILLSIS